MYKKGGYSLLGDQFAASFEKHSRALVIIILIVIMII